MSVEFSHDKSYLAVFDDDPFMRGFLAELYNRPSCHRCPCKGLRSGSDLTIADYWGVATRLPDMDDDKGTSLVMVNTERGGNAFSALAGRVIARGSDFDHAVAGNSAIVRATSPHMNRGRFFRCVLNSDFDSLVDLMLRPSLPRRIRASVGRSLYKLGILK